jgi:hypothetical protein
MGWRADGEGGGLGSGGGVRPGSPGGKNMLHLVGVAPSLAPHWSAVEAKPRVSSGLGLLAVPGTWQRCQCSAQGRRPARS